MKKTLLIIFILLIPPGSAAAQTSRKGTVPRVGIIKDVNKASKDIPEDCGNFLLSKTQGLTDKYVFLAGPEGLDAWMNLNGRDTRLKLLKTTLWYRATGVAFRHEYRAGQTHVTFSYEPLRKFVVPYPTTIVVRQGRASRTIRAFGYPQCD